MSSPLYRLDPDVRGRVAPGLPLVHLLEGYVDAGGVTERLSEALLTGCDHEALAVFDSDVLHDFRARRPMMVFDENHWQRVTMPELILHRVTDADGRDFLLLAGEEPDMRWPSTVDALLALVDELRVSLLLTATGIPMAVPHTRPTLVTTHANRPELIGSDSLDLEHVEVPGSFAALLEVRAGERGVPAQGFVAHVPHYAAGTSYAKAAIAVAHRIEQAAGLRLPLSGLQLLGDDTTARLDEEMKNDDDLREGILDLERRFDEQQERGSMVPTPDEIGLALERFLAEREREGEG